MPNQNTNPEDDAPVLGLFDNSSSADTTIGLMYNDSDSPVEMDYDAEPLVYGLEGNKEEYEARKNRLATLRYVLGGIMAAVLIIGALMVAKPLNLGRKSEGPRTEPVVAKKDLEEEEEKAEEEAESSDQEEQSKEEAEPEPEPEQEAEPEPEPEPEPEDDGEFTLSVIPTAADIDQAARRLSFNGEDLSLRDADIKAEVLKGRVQITHVLHDLSTVEPNLVAGNAARRVAALTNMLNGHDVQGTGEQEASPFVDAIWIVRDEKGDSFLAVSFPAGGAPAEGDGLVVLTKSPRYRLSDSMYEALGRTVQQENGETPVTLDNVYIWSTASF